MADHDDDQTKSVLQRLDESAKIARAAFLTLILASAYGFLAVWETTDRALIMDSSDLALPILDVTMSVNAYFFVGPLILLVIYFHLNAQLVEFWRGVRHVPDPPRDGRGLDESLYPWLFMGVFVRYSVGRPSLWRRPLQWIESWAMIGAVWGMVPVVILLFWGAYLSRHDWQGTAVHVLMLALVIGAAAGFFLHNRNELRRRTESAHQTWLTTGRCGVLLGGAVFLFLGWFSFSAITGVPFDECEEHRKLMEMPETSGGDPGGEKDFPDGIWQPCSIAVAASASLLRMAGIEPSPQLTSEVLFTPPPQGEWIRYLTAFEPATESFGMLESMAGEDKRIVDACNPDDENYGNCVKARLQGAVGLRIDAQNLTHMQAARAKLWGVEAKDTNLLFSNLNEARLESAKLVGADLRFAELSGARLNAARLDFANLLGAQMFEARLPWSNIMGASFRFSELSGADMRRVKGGSIRPRGKNQTRVTDFSYARMSGADLSRLSCEDCMFYGAVMNGAKLIKANLNSADLRKVDLSDADLTCANLTGADLSGAVGLTPGMLGSACGDEYTKLPEKGFEEFKLSFCDDE